MNFKKLRSRAKVVKKDIGLIYAAYRHPRTPWYAKLIIILVVAYALSPIDLIPDFIPFLGYLDDLIIVPLVISLSLKLIPRDVIEECRQKTQDANEMKKRGKYAGIIIVFFWIWIVYIILRSFKAI